MTPTRSMVDGLRLDGVPQASQKANSYAGFIADDAVHLRDTITGLDWSGGARAAAEGRATSECTELCRVSSAFTSLATAIDNGHASMSHIVSTLRQGTAGYEADGYEVADNWTVSDGYNYGLADAFASGHPDQQARLAELKRARADHAATATVRMTRLAHELAVADHDCAAAIRAASAALDSSAPVASGIGGGSGSDVAESLKNGTPLTPAQLDQLRAAGTLTPEQLRRIANGLPAGIPQGQYDFLRGLSTGLGGTSISDLVRMGTGTDHDQVQSGLANALEVMGNPSMGTAAGDHGGVTLLPTSARTLMTDNLIGSGFSIQTGGRAGSHRLNGVSVPRINDFHKFVDLMDRSNPALREGSDIDRGLLRQTAEISAATQDPSIVIRESPHSAAPGYGHEDLNHVLNKAMSVSSPDTIASHDFITGHNMGPLMGDGKSYNVSEHINGLLKHQWGDQDGGVQKVFSWVGSDATSSNPFVASQAHEAASTLGHYFGNVHNLSVTEDFGLNNPHLAQTFAKSLSPYLGGFAGAPDGPHGVPTLGVNPLNPGELHTLFQAMDSDPTSGALFNDASHKWQNLMAYQYGLNHEHPSLGHAAGLLDQAMTRGYNDELKHYQTDAYDSSAADYQSKMNRYSQSVAMVGAIPLVGTVASASIPPELGTSLFGAAPTPDSMSNPSIDGLKQIDISSLNDPEVREFSMLSGYIETHPEVKMEHPEWFTDGKPDWDAISSAQQVANTVRDFTGATQQQSWMSGWNSQFDNGTQAPDRAGEVPDYP